MKMLRIVKFVRMVVSSVLMVSVVLAVAQLVSMKRKMAVIHVLLGVKFVMPPTHAIDVKIIIL